MDPCFSNIERELEVFLDERYCAYSDAVPFNLLSPSAVMCDCLVE